MQRDFSFQREDPMKIHPLGSLSKAWLSSSMLNVAAFSSGAAAKVVASIHRAARRLPKAGFIA
jgi:hypothetical protein